MKNYDIPFYSNTEDDTHCFQAVIKMVLKFFWPDKEFTWAELDKITAKVEGLWTWQMAGLLWLDANGFEVKDIEAFDYDQFVKKGGNYLVNVFGKEVGESQIRHSKIDQEIEYAKTFVQKIRPEVRIPVISEIPHLLEAGYIIVCNVNSHALNKKEGYAGHFVVIKGFDKDTLTLHDPGLPPEEDRRVDFQTFEQAWAYPNESAKNIMAFRLKQFREGQPMTL